MKVIFALFFLVTLTLAEPPRFRQFARQEAAPAPYSPSGWKPSGDRFTLPSRQLAAPQNKYGPPPKPSYGPPPEVTTPVDITTVEPESETIATTESERFTAPKKQKIERGQYYLLLEDGRLQRVMYVTESDLKNMGFSARLKYSNVEPITGPIFNGAYFAQPFVPVQQ